MPSLTPRPSRVVLLLALVLSLGVLLGACGGGEEAAEPAPQAEGETAAEEPAAAETETEGEAAAAEEPVTLKLASFLGADHPVAAATIPLWTDLVEEKSNGSITIDFVGGPEAVPTEEQFGALVNGVIDVNFNVPTFYLNQVPAGNTMHLSPFSPAEERDNGYAEYLDRIHRDAGAAYLGRWISVQPFFLYSNTEVDGLDDFRGKRIRSTTTYFHILEELGANNVSIVPSDVFSALERGIVDGYAFVLLGPRDLGWIEFTEVLVNEPFYNQNGAITINPATLESLSDAQEAALREATAEFEDQLPGLFLDLNRQEWEAIQDLVEVVELPEAESDRFANLWYEETWAALVEDWQADEADIEEAKELLGYDDLVGQPDRIRELPCGPAGEAAADEPFC